MTDTEALTGGQLRAARAMLRWTREELEEHSGVPVGTIKRLEGADGPVSGTYRNITRLRSALERGGAEFTPDGGVRPRS